MRIDRLESLVQQLLDQGGHQLARAISATSSASDTDPRPEDDVASPYQPLSGTGMNRRPPGALVTAPARTRRCLKHKGHWETLLSQVSALCAPASMCLKIHQVKDSVTFLNTPSTGNDETYMYEDVVTSQIDCAAQLLHGLRPLTYRLPARSTQDVLMNRFFLRVSPAVRKYNCIRQCPANLTDAWQMFCTRLPSMSRYRR